MPRIYYSYDAHEGDYFFKIKVVGARSAGITSLCQRFSINQFSINEKPSIGPERHTRHIQAEGKVFNLQIWDAPSVRSGSYRIESAMNNPRPIAYMIVYDISKKESFEEAKKIFENIKSEARELKLDPPVLMLIGNKSDLRHLRNVTTEEAKQYADTNHLLFLETSALDSNNVELAFHNLLTEIYHRLYKPDETRRAEAKRIENEPIFTQRLIDKFLKKYNEFLEESRKSKQIFSVFTSSHVEDLKKKSEELTLDWILKHAKEKKGGNRTFRTCVSLNWLKKDGSLHSKAPSLVEEAYLRVYPINQKGPK